MRLVSTCAVSLLLAALFADPAMARGHVSIGVGIGAPWPLYYPPPYYYYPPVVAVPAAPPVYIERSAGEDLGTADWYYCDARKAYYPYVKDCPAGWRRVPSQPPQ